MSIITNIELKSDLISDMIADNTEIEDSIIEFNFSDMDCSIVKYDDFADDCDISIIPNNYQTLHKLLAIFPLYRYDISIIHRNYFMENYNNHNGQYLHIDIEIFDNKKHMYAKEYGSDLDSGLYISDNDYEYIRDILSKNGRNIESIEDRIKVQIADYTRYLVEDFNANFNIKIIDDITLKRLQDIISARWKEMKLPGYAHMDKKLYEEKILKDVITKMILENSLNMKGE